MLQLHGLALQSGNTQLQFCLQLEYVCTAVIPIMCLYIISLHTWHINYFASLACAGNCSIADATQVYL